MNEQILSLLKQLRADTRLASFDEAATKQIVLLRVLSLLGWDIYNIDEVKPEFAVGSQRVDYSLRNKSINKVFIEVKKVGEDLDRHQEQLLNYSFKEGVKLAILTNGIRGSKRPYYTKNANELRIPQRVEGSDIFMETNLSSRSIVGICKNMIALFGYSEEELTIEAH